MTTQDLIASASLLRAPGEASLKEFTQKREGMAVCVNKSMNQRPDLEKMVGPDGKDMSQDNNRNFSLFMESLMVDFRPEVLVDTALWVFRAYRSHGFQTTYWPANLNTWMKILEQELTREAFEEISPFYVWLITHIPVFAGMTDDLVKDRS